MKLKKSDISEFFDKELSRPTSLKTLMKVLKIEKRDRIQFRNVLKQLTREGRIIKIKGNRYAPPNKLDLVVGRYQIHRDGTYGFVIPDNPDRPEIYVRTTESLKSMNGDRVVARIEGYRPGAGPRGRIIRILEEYQDTIVGKFELKEGYGIVYPFDRRINNEIFIPSSGLKDAQNGEFVRVKIEARPKTGSMIIGSIDKVLGFDDVPWIDRLVIENQYNLRTEFPAKVIKEAERILSTSKIKFNGQRIDFQDKQSVTIDGEDARDFDDAVHLERDESDNYILYVHIADVAEYVSEKSPIDDEAYLRATSVYFTEKAIPMLPEQLSNNLCALKPNEPRLSFTCKMVFNKSGRKIHSELMHTIIKSHKRLTYNQVYSIINNDYKNEKIPGSICSMLLEMHSLSKLLRKIRLSRGSIDFDFPEVGVNLTDDGEVTGIKKIETNDAHRIIEEFMIAANETVAEFLISKGINCLFRIHEAPDINKVINFLEVYRELGYEYRYMGDHPTPLDFSKMLQKVVKSKYETMIGRLILKSMKLARYSSNNVGHFGLASDAYTHFTSPIRRYPDIVVHRKLKEVIGTTICRFYHDIERSDLFEESQPHDNELTLIASHCSTQERNAEDAERELIKWRQIKYMKTMVDELFNALIIDVTSYGLYIELVDYYIEGLIHISSIYDDFYHYDNKKKTFKGEKTGKLYSIGQNIKVLIYKIDVERRQIDFIPYGLEIRRKRERKKSEKRQR